MSEMRKPTARLGRVKKDPRIDSVPPPTPRRSIPPPARSRLSEGMLPRVEGRSRGAFQDEAKTNPLTRLEELLAREKAERELDADRMGELLARATRAEAERQKLLERLTDAEARLSAVERDKAALESQIAGGGRRKHDSVPTLATARAIASELARVLERIRDNKNTLPPSRGSLSDLPAPKSSKG